MGETSICWIRIQLALAIQSNLAQWMFEETLLSLMFSYSRASTRFLYSAVLIYISFTASGSNQRFNILVQPR